MEQQRQQFCTKCGSEVKSQNQKFCVKCGSVLPKYHVDANSRVNSHQPSILNKNLFQTIPKWVWVSLLFLVSIVLVSLNSDQTQYQPQYDTTQSSPAKAPTYPTPANPAATNKQPEQPQSSCPTGADNIEFLDIKYRLWSLTDTSFTPKDRGEMLVAGIIKNNDEDCHASRISFRVQFKRKSDDVILQEETVMLSREDKSRLLTVRPNGTAEFLNMIKLYDSLLTPESADLLSFQNQLKEDVEVLYAVSNASWEYYDCRNASWQDKRTQTYCL